MGWLKRLAGLEEPSIGVAAHKRVFAVGDIHGRLDLLDQLLPRLKSHAESGHQAQNILIFLGDYVDRGADSHGVIERLASLDQELPDWTLVFLRGNHDQAVLDFLDDANFYRAWRSFGAAETLLSYGVLPPRFESEMDFKRARDEFAQRLPRKHLEFMNKLHYSHVEDDYLFVHAGIRPGIALADQSLEDLLWIREDFLLHRRRFEKMVVHGHTPSPSTVTLRNRICIDTGAHATGRLTALALEGKNRMFLDVTRKVRPAGTMQSLEAAAG